MEYNRIVAVTGLPGLYEIVGSKSDGAIVRSLEDGTTKFVSSRVHNLSHLESIEVYTVRDNVNLADIFLAMQNSTTALPDVKDNKALKGYFETVYPDLDFERVYASDMKKMVKWFDVLRSKGVEIKLDEPTEEEATEEPVAVEETKAEEAKPKTTKKKKDVAKVLEDANEKIVLDVNKDEVPEVAKPKRGRKKKDEAASTEE
ncbi:MAG: hypothetical protein C4329_01495 [Chitinophagaceae bacterium]